MNSEQEMDDHLAISDSKTASDVSPEASSQNDSSKGIMCSMLDCCQKCVKEIMCKFLSNCGLSTIEDLKKNIPSKVEGMEFNVGKYEKYYENLKHLNLCEGQVKDVLIFFDILHFFFIEKKTHSLSYEKLEKLRSLRNSFSHPDNFERKDCSACFGSILQFIEAVSKDFETIFSSECIEQLRTSTCEHFRSLDPFYHEPPLMSNDLKKEVHFYESCSLLVLAKDSKDDSEDTNNLEYDVPLVEQSCLTNILDVFKHAQCLKVVFLVGDSGAGKSHLARSVARSWLSRKNKGVQRFKLVLFLDVCDVKTTVYHHLTECYPEVFSYMEKLSSSDSKEKTFMKFWCLWPVLVIIDGYCSQFSQHAKFVDEIKELFTDATLLITACSKDVDNLGKKFISVSSKSKKKIIIDYMTHEQALDFAEKVLSFLNLSSVQENFCLFKKYTTQSSIYLKYPLDIILFCIILKFDPSQHHQPESYMFTQSKLVAHLCNVCQQKDLAEYVKFSKALGNAALQTFVGCESSYCDVIELSLNECMKFNFSMCKMQTTPCGKVSYRFPNKCFLQHFAATSIAESCDEKITILQSQDKICSPRSLYLRLELLLLPLISCFLKTQKSSTLELVKVLENIVKYIDCNLLFWGSVVHEAGPQMPTKLRSFIDENLCDLDRRWVMTERNYEVCFGCLSCISTPPDLTIDLRKCNQVNVVESMGLLFEKLPHDLFNLSSVDATLLYHSKAAPLRLNFPSWVKVKKVKGSISKDDISVVLQYPHLTSVYIKISQIHILTAFIDSINNSFEELQDVTLKLDASIAESHQEVNALREIEELAVKVVGVSKENFNNVVDILLKLLPKTNNGTTIELSSSNLGAPHCKKIIDVFSHFTGGLITVSSEVDLTSEEKESIKLLLSRDLDGLYRLPPFQLEWNGKQW